MWSALLILAGLAGLLVGAELLVRGATALASRLGIRPMVIGLTVVSLGTSLPELAIGIDAARQGSPGLAVGNVVGANLINILFILGLSALIRPITFERPTLRFDLPAMTAASLALWILALDGSLARVDGIVLCLAGVAYTAGIVWTSRQESEAVASGHPSKTVAAPARGRPRPMLHVLALVAGIAIIIVGAELLVDGSIEVARSLEVSEAIIGLTVLAIGTTAPELVTTVVSTIRGDRDIAIGNLLGSSVYNIAVILGITILVAPSALAIPPEVVAADLLLLAVATVITVPVLLSGQRMTRVEGGAFVAAYVGYLLWLILG
jgi:cation:H+ antiporter